MNFKCAVCYEEFSDKNTLRSHIQAHDEGVLREDTSVLTNRGHHEENIFNKHSPSHTKKAVWKHSSIKKEDASREDSPVPNEEEMLRGQSTVYFKDINNHNEDFTLNELSPTHSKKAVWKHSSIKKEDTSIEDSPVPNEEEMLRGQSTVYSKEMNNDNEDFTLNKHSPTHSKKAGRKHSSIYKEEDKSREDSPVPNEDEILRGQSTVHNKDMNNHIEDFTLKEQCPLIYPIVKIEYKRYKCHTCSKVFTKNGHLKVHLLTHTSERPFKCIVCSKSFTQSGNLKRHLATHVNERPRQCSFCNQTFAQVGQLKLHLLVHTDGRPYQCTVCEKSFTQKGDLNRHMLIHSKERPHECHLCNQKFKQSAHLKGHLLTHTGERPYQCTMCEKAYKESGHLKRHMQTHINDRPHQCTICEKSFIRSEHLKRHLLTHSNETPSSFLRLQVIGDSHE